MSQRIIAIVLSTAFSLVLLLVLFWSVDWAALGARLRETDGLAVALTCALIAISHYLRALRWRHLLPSEDAATLGALFWSIMVGGLATYLLPLRAGEFLRPYVLSRRSSVSLPVALSSVVVERIADVFCLLILLGLVVERFGESSGIVLAAAKGLGAVALLAAMAVGLMIAWPRVAASCFTNLLKKPVARFSVEAGDFLQNIYSEVQRAVLVLRKPSSLFLTVFWSAAMWGSIVLVHQSALWAFKVYPSIEQGIVVTVAIGLAVALPSAPGFLGVFQAGCSLALATVYAYSDEFALGFSIVLHAANYLVVVGLGVLGLRILDFRWKLLQSREPAPKPVTVQSSAS